MRHRKRNLRPLLFSILLAVVLIPLFFVFFIFFEGEDPVVAVDLSTPYVGSSRELPVIVSDNKSGLRRVWIAVIKDGSEKVLLDQAFAGSGLLSRGQVKERTIPVQLDLEKLAISDGEAMLRLNVWDYSWRGWWKGNSTYLEKKIVIDTVAPKISVLSRAHNINQGGSGLVVYRLSEPCNEHGVVVGDRLYPGHAGYFKDPSVYIALMALSDSQGTDTELAVKATDPAGNTNQSGFYYHIRRKRFKQDVINISDGFLKAKLPEFSQVVAKKAGSTRIEQFLEINRNLRRVNYEIISKITSKSEAALLWEGKFGRLPKAAPRADFGDRRTYKYKGKEIDRQVHLGIDLASLANAEVPAGNSGAVVYADYLGIYGNTVVIDHGFGLFSMYSHLSQISVNKGDMVVKNAIIGRTGLTGLAGGDHLHYSMLVNNTFINPIEWWDAKWLKHNVTDKLADVRLQLGQEKKK